MTTGNSTSPGLQARAFRVDGQCLAVCLPCVATPPPASGAPLGRASGNVRVCARAQTLLLPAPGGA
eukprot:1705124-Alexandrium_andersonii.AAC.1